MGSFNLVRSGVLGTICVLILAFSIGSCSAQLAEEYLEIADPRAYVDKVMSDVEGQGIVAAEELFASMGLKTPQNTATFDLIKTQEDTSRANWTTVIGEVNSGSAMRQIYTYTYLGNNVWFFWRFDFFRTDDEHWASGNVFFDSDHAKVIGQNFQFLE